MVKDTLAVPELSAFRALQNRFERLVSVVDVLRCKVADFIPQNVKFSAVHYEKSERILIERLIPMDDFILLDGSPDGKKARVLKDDGRNNNIVSQEFFEKNCKDFNWKQCNVEVSHSQKGLVEKS